MEKISRWFYLTIKLLSCKLHSHADSAKTNVKELPSVRTQNKLVLESSCSAENKTAGNGYDWVLIVIFFLMTQSWRNKNSWQLSFSPPHLGF